MLWLLAREGDDCLPICEGDDGDCFLAALGAGAVPILAACCTPTHTCWPKGLQLIHPLRKHQLLRSLWTPSFDHIPENKAWSHCLVQQVLQRFVQQLALTWCCLGREMMLSSDFSRENVIQSLSLPQQLAVWL